MDKYEQIMTSSDTTGVTEASVDERTGRRIIPTGINALSGLVHTSFEPIENVEDVIIPYHQ